MWTQNKRKIVIAFVIATWLSHYLVLSFSWAERFLLELFKFPIKLSSSNYLFMSLLLQTYRKTKHLQDLFKVVSTSKDRKGVEFISNMEGNFECWYVTPKRLWINPLFNSSVFLDCQCLSGKRYPIYLFHWHPSKAQYELRTDLDIKHSFRLILAAQYLADFFIRQGNNN